jgi:tetratricopeptide (TPR) repeat protein
MLAGFLGEHVVAEDLALVGAKYFPTDGALQYYLGQARARLGRRDAAEHALRDAIRLAPDMVAARALLVVQLIGQGRHTDALEVLEAGREHQPDDRRAAAELNQLEQAIQNRRLLLWGGGLLLALAVPITWFLGTAGLAVGLLGGGVAGLGLFLFHRQLEAVIARQQFEEISQGLRRLHRRTRGNPVVS